MLGITFSNFKREGFVNSPMFEARRQDTGEPLLLTVHGRVERTDAGDFVRTHCVLIDVTAQAKAEAETQSLQRLLEQITAQMPGMVFQYRLRPNGTDHFPYASKGIHALLHVMPEELVHDAKAAFRHVHPEDLSGLRASIAESAALGRPWRHRFRVVLSHGRYGWLQGNASPHSEPDGSCLWHGFMMDVSHEVAAEESLRVAASVFANAQEGIVITDPGGFISDVNPAFSRITGYPRDEVLGRSPKMLASGHQDREFYARMWGSIAQTGAWRGEIWNRDKEGRVYPELLSVSAVKNDVGFISHYIGTFSDISHLKEREIQLDRIAHFDPLTGLPNRRLLSDRLALAITHTQRVGKIMAVCVLDLDAFKPINDTFGHAAGDAVLVTVSKRLAQCVRENDTVARMGGDEFAIVLLNLNWVEECDAILKRLLEAVTAPIAHAGQALTVSASIGVSLCPQDNHKPEALLKNADQAMYLAKKAGRNRYRFFTPEHDRLVRDYRRLIEDLMIALEKDQFILHYQPKVSLLTGQVMGVEALIRWRHPERGLLNPSEFLYATAHAGLDVSIGYWVLDHALAQLAHWRAQGITLPVSINCSPNSILDATLPAYLAHGLGRHKGLRGEDLEIELLESEALLTTRLQARYGQKKPHPGAFPSGAAQTTSPHASSTEPCLDEGKVIAAIAACQALGVHIALDGFGVGYLSPAYFRNVPALVFKIDHGLIREICNDPDDQAVLEDIIKMAKGFHREIIVKGVEEAHQTPFLLKLGCEIAQGYAIARPMPADSLISWLGNHVAESV